MHQMHTIHICTQCTHAHNGYMHTMHTYTQYAYAHMHKFIFKLENSTLMGTGSTWDIRKGHWKEGVSSRKPIKAATLPQISAD